MNGFSVLLWKSLRSGLHLRRIAREQSVFKMLFIAAFMLAMVAGLFAMFVRGFAFLDVLGGMGVMILNRLFALFFFGLALMLALSGGISAYTTIYRSEEMPFLLLKPLTLTQILLYKTLESAWLSSWAFFLIILPFIGAYVWHVGLSPVFFLWTFVFSVPYVILCAGLGTLVCFAVVRWFPHRGWARALLLGLALGGVVWAVLVSAGSVQDDADTAVVLSRLLPGIRIASHPLWPSWWVSEGIMSLSRGHWSRGLGLLAVLLSNLLMMGAVIDLAGRRLFFDGWLRVMGAGARKGSRAVLLVGLDRLLGFLAADTRALMLKDARIFLRDAAQWSQGLIFFGLLGIYFFNLRNLNYHLLTDVWINLITFLNIFGVSSVMCSFGTRFVYPQPSLEGHGFWIVGMAPTTMGRVLRAKFIGALATLGSISLVLMGVSAYMLKLDAELRTVALAVSAAIAVAVVGLSTGLGAIFMDRQQKNPAAIISGFGGTLNLVLSLCFMLAAIAPFGMLFHVRASGDLAPGAFGPLLAGGYLWLLFITLLAGVLPVALGCRSLARREY